MFWDDRESLAEQMLLEAATIGNPQMLEQQQQGEELGAQGPYGTNDFWLEPVSAEKGSNRRLIPTDGQAAAERGCFSVLDVGR